jgi:hypothetical protein
VDARRLFTARVEYAKKKNLLCVDAYAYIQVCEHVRAYGYTHMRTWFQRWLSAGTEESSMLGPEWLPEVVLVKADVMLEAERSSSAPEDVDVRWCWCVDGANGGHRAGTPDGGGGQAP